MTILYVLLGIFILLQIADLVTTFRNLASGGEEEAAAMLWLAKVFGSVKVTLVISKVVLIGIATWAVFGPGRMYLEPIALVLGVFCTVYAWVVVHNVDA